MPSSQAPHKETQRPGMLRRAVGRAVKVPPAEDRYARLREIESLDPVKDCQRVHWLHMEDFKAAAAFQVTGGLYITYAAPRMSRILHQSGELENRILKRLVDTILLDETQKRHGYGPGPGRDALRRVNEMHKKYDIHPDDFVLINCFDAVLRIWLAETYGWRPLSDNERIAIVEFFKLRGSYMAGKGKHPETYEGMAEFVENWKKEQLRFEPQNKILADSLMEFILSDVPTIFRPIARAFFLSVGPDERLITNCHHEMPPVWVQKICRAAMKVYGHADPLTDGLMPQTQKLVDRVYPNGYSIDRLGTHLRPAQPDTDTTLDETGTLGGRLA